MNKIYEEIEILTITYKSDHIIEKCLSNIDTRFKTTIVENSNNINIKKNLELRENTKCILANANLGFGAAFNLGAKSINTKYIFHLNPDVVVNNNVITEMYETANNINNLGIMSVKESNLPLKINNNFNNKYEEVNMIRGFVMFINNWNCRNSGYFDENFFLYLEEIDLCKRLLLENKVICIKPNITVQHYGGKSHDPKYSQAMELQRNWHYMWSLFYFNKKHKGSFFAYRITIKKFLSAFIKSIYYFFINKNKYQIYKHRFLGLLNSYLGNKSNFRVQI